MITTLGDDGPEMNFILEEQYAKPFAEQGVDFRKQTVFMEILVAVDDDPSKTWERIETTRKAFVDYFGDDLPTGLIYPFRAFLTSTALLNRSRASCLAKLRLFARVRLKTASARGTLSAITACVKSWSAPWLATMPARS